MLELRARHVDVDRLNLRRLQLRLGLHDVRTGRDAGVVAILRKLERARIRRHRFIEQLFLPIGRRELPVSGCHRCLMDYALN